MAHLGKILLLLTFVSLRFASAQSPGLFDESRVSLLPEIFPTTTGLSPLEQARAQALISFLQTHRIFSDDKCDLSHDLCLPDFVGGQGPHVFPDVAQQILIPPVGAPIAVDFKTASQGLSPTYGLTFLARSGDLIYAPFSGRVQLIQPLTAGRTQISIEHFGQGEGGDLRLSVLMGQFETDLSAGDQVETGQPIGRARPRDDSKTRLIYSLIIAGQQVDPQPWLQGQTRAPL